MPPSGRPNRSDYRRQGDLVQQNFDLPREHRDRLRELARAEERSLAAELRLIVKRRLDEADTAVDRLEAAA